MSTPAAEHRIRPRSAHHRGQARRPGAAAARGRARRLGAGGGQAARAGQEDRPGADRACCSTRAPSPSSTSCARHRAHDFGIEATRPYGDGVVTGYGTVDGRPVCVFSQDFTVFGGSLGEVYGEKIVKIMDHRAEDRLPDDRHQRRRRRPDPGGRGRARPVTARSSTATCMASGVIPQISLIMGPCAGGAVYSPAITDFIVMVDETSHMFITGPDVIKTVTGEDVDVRGARRRARAQRQVRRRPLPGQDEEDVPRLRPRAAVLPALEQPGRPARLTARAGPTAELDRRRRRARHPDPGLAEPAVRHARGHRRTSLDDGEFLEVHAAVRAEHRRRFRPGRRPARRRGGEPAAALRRLPSTSTPPRRRPASSAPATRSTSRC